MSVKIFDTECVWNFWLLKFLDADTGHIDTFSLIPYGKLDINGIQCVIANNTIVGFNSQRYDAPMIAYALAGASCEQLKIRNDEIIAMGANPWDYSERLCADHIDLFDVAPGSRIGLKTYAAVLHSRNLQEMPFDPAAVFTPLDMMQCQIYCENDLYATLDLWEACKDRIEMRIELNAQFNTPKLVQHNGGRALDLRSKSDPQVAEAVFAYCLGYKPEPRRIPHGQTFNYRAPAFLKFNTLQMQDVLALVQRENFMISDRDQVGEELVDSNGEKIRTGVIMPPAVKNLRPAIGANSYKFGIGGLHSHEKSISYYTTSDYVITDHDVSSYYPSLIILMGMLSDLIRPIYKQFYDSRIWDKLHGDGALSKRLKTVLNGIFGKLGSKYSFLFAPEDMIQVTITGQLCLLMLIERLELAGISVISANTDGIVLRTPTRLVWLRDAIIRQWEVDTGLSTERTHYKSIHFRDVNNYVAICDDGHAKAIGEFASPGLKVSGVKTPDCYVCSQAVINYLQNGIPLEMTIRNCKDVRNFVVARKVKGGAVRDGQFLGSVVRWYYGANSTSALNYKTSGNKVATSDGSVPLMRLPDVVPADIDYARYEMEAHKMLSNMGVIIE